MKPGNLVFIQAWFSPVKPQPQWINLLLSSNLCKNEKFLISLSHITPGLPVFKNQARRKNPMEVKLISVVSNKDRADNQQYLSSTLV